MSEAIKIQAGYTDYSEVADDKALREKIKAVLRRYFDCNDDGTCNPEYDEDFTASDAMNAIHEIVGDI